MLTIKLCVVLFIVFVSRKGFTAHAIAEGPLSVENTIKTSREGPRNINVFHQNRNEAPDSLKHRLKTGDRLLDGGGATNPYPRSFSALRLPILSMWEKNTRKILSDIQDGLKYVLQTKNEWTMVLHATGTTGMAAVLDNLIEPGDKVLVGIYGYWGALAANMSERFGANVVRVEKPPGSRFTLDEIESAVEEHRPKILFLVNGESSTGVYQPLDGVGDICHTYDCLLVSDIIAIVGQQPVKMDERKIDVVYMNSQKGLGGIVGLAPVSFSPRAVEKLQNRTMSPNFYPTTIIKQAKAWGIDKSVGIHDSLIHSISLPLLYMLREGLATLADEKIENVWRRHWNAQTYFHDRARQMGFEFYVPNEEDRLIGTSTFLPPPGKDPVKIESFVFHKYRIEISPGMGPTFGKVVRVGLFGNNADPRVAYKILNAIQDAYNSPWTNAS